MERHRPARALWLLAVAALLCLLPPRAEGAKLERYNIDTANITTSGISSGACMATQLHVSWSSLFSGVASLAGVPYWCARDNVANALLCIEAPSSVHVNQLVEATTFAEDTLSIDDTKNMQNDKVWLFSGTLDNVVSTDSVKQVEAYYEHYIPDRSNFMTQYSLPAAHTWPTVDWGNPCNISAEPYLSYCDYDTAQSIFSFFHGTLRNATAAPPNNILSFSQEYYTPLKVLPALLSLDSIGYVYVPTACRNGAKCALHVTFHGCLQGRKYVGLDFVQHSGFNEWAEANNIIVLYPQAVKTAVNPQGCWDWWGYTGTAYATKLGPQIATIKGMIDALVG